MSLMPVAKVSEHIATTSLALLHIVPYGVHKLPQLLENFVKDRDTLTEQSILITVVNAIKKLVHYKSFFIYKMLPSYTVNIKSNLKIKTLVSQKLSICAMQLLLCGY